MSTGAIGYVETVREDLLEAAWRSTMAEPIRVRRRRPSLRWVVAGATAFTLLAAGGVGWLVLSEGGPLTRMSGDARGELGQGGATPAPSDRGVFGVAIGDQASKHASPTSLTQSADLSGASVTKQASITLPGDLSKIVKTARLSIVVGHDTFGDRFSQVGEIADRLGGYISQSSTRGGRSGYVTMRVPAGRFQEALRSLRGLGRVDSEDVQGRDVTAQFVDLSARLRIALARRRVLFGLMNRAVSIEQTIRVQNALDDVQLRIEDLQGEINVLNDRVSQATIRVSMRETGVQLEAETNVRNPSILGAFDRAIAGFFSVIAGVIVGLGWVLPSLAVLALLWFVGSRVRRRLVS